MFQPVSPEYLAAELDLHRDRIRTGFTRRLRSRRVHEDVPPLELPRQRTSSGLTGRSRVRVV